METTTEIREPEMGLTFEKVWAMMQETDRRMKETDRQMQETDRRMKETDRQMKEMSDRTERMLQEAAQEIRETARRQKETARQIGALGNRFGELAEHLVAPGIVEKFNALGFHFSAASEMRQIIWDDDRQTAAEFDIMLDNGEASMGVEVKAKPSVGDVEEHVKRLEIFRLHQDKKGDDRKIYGALAGAIMPRSVKSAALKAGLYVITQTGDTVKIDVPEGFKPKVW
ncbi:MAG: hypothetical protein LBT65_10810 [Synergistaceae bacterium]|nr:hypothetical protein [Synergistaceae bacterium]